LPTPKVKRYHLLPEKSANSGGKAGNEKPNYPAIFTLPFLLKNLEKMAKGYGIMISYPFILQPNHAVMIPRPTNQRKIMTLLPAIERETRPKPDSTVIWLHGLGADGNDFAPIVEQLRLPASMGVRFIFPHAPSMPVTVNGGFVMPAWYDILEMQIDRRVDQAGLLASAKAIGAFVDRELARGIAGKRLIIAGFSQGGAVAYHLALSHPTPLGGLLAMSTYLATAEILPYSPANKEIPVNIQHGTDDPIVPETLGRKAASRLKEEGYQISYQSYPMEHSVCPEQINDISRWLQNLLA
jgi:phospholipase/carboxylesterase